MSLLMMDNFGKLDVPKTTGVMDYTWLSAKYTVFGTPDARVQTVSSRNVLNLNTRVNTLVAPWLIMAGVPTNFDTYTASQHILTWPTGANQLAGSFGLVNDNGDGSYSAVLLFTAYSGALCLYRIDPAGNLLTNILTVPNAEHWIEYTFVKASNDPTQYTSFTVYVDNSPILVDSLFCNAGNNLKVVLAGTLPTPTFIAASPPYVGVIDSASRLPQNFAYPISDFYLTNGGTRYGRPIISDVPVASVTTNLASTDPTFAFMGSVPNKSNYASGSGKTTVNFNSASGDVAQLSTTVQSNSMTPHTVTLKAGTNTSSTSVSTASYVRVIDSSMNDSLEITT